MSREEQLKYYEMQLDNRAKAGTESNEHRKCVCTVSQPFMENRKAIVYIMDDKQHIVIQYRIDGAITGELPISIEAAKALYATLHKTFDIIQEG